MSVMNIIDSATTNYCDDKCSLSFNYPPSSTCVVGNSGPFFLFSYNIDPTSTPVTFSNSKYIVAQIILFSPSVHLFNGSTAEAELVIFHYDSANRNNLLEICIPISSSSGKSSQVFSNILNDVVEYNMNKPGDQETFYIQNYNLNDIIPYKPYFYYQQGSNNIVVYGIQNAINVPAKILNDIANYITPYPSPESIFPYESNLFFNQKGPGVSDSGEIYIDCQPINSATETVEVAFKKQTISGSSASSNNTIGIMFTNLGLNYTTVVIIFVILLIGVVYVALARTNLLNNTRISKKPKGNSETFKPFINVLNNYVSPGGGLSNLFTNAKQ